MGVGGTMENGLISAMDGAWTLLGFNKLISGTAKQLLADAWLSKWSGTLLSKTCDAIRGAIPKKNVDP